MLKKFLIWLIKSILMLLVVTLIFSSITLDFPGLVKSVFGDIFAYASPEAQKQVVGELAGACSSLEKGNEFVANIGAICADYKSGKINDKEFFFGIISSALPVNAGMPQIGALDKYNRAISYLNKNKVWYFVILLVLTLLLYLLIMNVRLFLIILSQISFGIGMIIMLPYIAIIIYRNFVGFDTTPILGSMLGAGSIFDAKAISSVILLMILRTYSSFIIVLGILLLGAGIAGKVYSWKLKKQSSKPEPKEGKRIKEEKLKKEKQTKEEEGEAHRHRDRSTKEILDELDEMHKKKIKKD
ncbi:hypothetical protein HYX04_03810 [Candidatus Woesearchaeota archaeon]|nr:hypothetical protein [Candidatus Woesearchaeota archaeon]